MYRCNVIALGKDRLTPANHLSVSIPAYSIAAIPMMPTIYTHAVANYAINPFLTAHLLTYRKSLIPEFKGVKFGILHAEFQPHRFSPQALEAVT